jgi:hypothetical protein
MPSSVPQGSKFRRRYVGGFLVLLASIFFGKQHLRRSLITAPN